MLVFKKIAFVVNPGKPGAAGLAKDLMDKARKAGAEVVQTTRYPLPDGFLQARDVCCLIGGDGTVLGAVVQAARSHVPLIGVNRGSLGFLTTFTPEEARETFTDVLAGRHGISHRSVLQCGETTDHLALNDVVIKEARSSRLISLDVFADGEWVTRFSCDGLLFSTPTGSTAYNLSAGGPIAHPKARIIAMTPICPHTLSNRSVIFEESVKLTVVNANARHRLSVMLDGQRGFEVAEGEELAITVSPLTIPLVQKAGHSHFGLLRTKLGWSGASGAEKREPGDVPSGFSGVV